MHMGPAISPLIDGLGDVNGPPTVHCGRGNRQKPRFEEIMEPSELAGLIEQVKKVDPVVFADALQKEAQGHFQVPFKRGFGTSKAESDEKIAALGTELEAAKQGKTDLDDELKELRKKQPDLEKWTSDKEAALLAKEDEWKGKYEALQADLLAGKTKAERQRVMLALKEKAHVIPYIAESALAREEVAARMKEQPDGTIRYYQKDAQMPLVAAEGEDVAELFARTLVAEKVIPPEFVKPPKNAGGPDYKGGSDGTPQGTKRSSMSVKEKSEYVDKHGQDAYLNLPA